MSKDSLPTQVNALRSAENAAIFHGTVLVEDMQRLRSSLLSNEGEVKVDLEFGIDRQKIRYVKGHYATELRLQCQRCMEPFSYRIVGDFISGLVNSVEEAENLPESYDPLIVIDNNLIIKDVIEDELILSLPIVPMHDPNDCNVTLPQAASDGSGTDFEKVSPFKVIESLKKK